MVSTDKQAPITRSVLAADFISGIEFRFHHGQLRRYRFRGKPGDGWLESANNNGLDEYKYCFVSAELMMDFITEALKVKSQVKERQMYYQGMNFNRSAVLKLLTNRI